MQSLAEDETTRDLYYKTFINSKLLYYKNITVDLNSFDFKITFSIITHRQAGVRTGSCQGGAWHFVTGLSARARRAWIRRDLCDRA